MATALRNLRVPTKQLQSLYRPDRWTVAVGGASALAVLGIVCWWWRSWASRSPGQRKKPPAGHGAGRDPVSRPVVEPLLRESETGVGERNHLGDSHGESSDSEIEEVLSRGALARLAAAKATETKQRAEAQAAKAFFFEHDGQQAAAS